MALGAGGGIPLGPVGHRGGEHDLALPVDLVQRVIAAGEFLLPRGGVVLAAAVGGLGFGASAEGGQVSVPGGGADLAELVTDVGGCPGGLDGVGITQVQQRPSGMPRTSGPSTGPRAARASYQAARTSGAAVAGSGPIASVGWS